MVAILKIHPAVQSELQATGLLLQVVVRPAIIWSPLTVDRRLADRRLAADRQLVDRQPVVDHRRLHRRGEEPGKANLHK